MASRRRDPAQVAAAVRAALVALAAGVAPDRTDLALAVRGTAEALAARSPGSSVELRIPPFSVVQCLAGPRHTRGTPPNVVETDPVTWLLLATGRLAWPDALAGGRLKASGLRADLTAVLPVQGLPPDLFP